MNPDKHNNFDLLRLFAALQVFIQHALHRGFLTCPFLETILKYVPGVPIFFMISGFLIFWSFDRNSNIKIFYRNRMLRLYPGLWVCMILTTIILLAFQTIYLKDLFTLPFILYFVSHCTFLFQFTPSILKAFAEGQTGPNAVLWTLGTELQFYLVLPLIYYLVKNKTIIVQNIILISIAVISYCFNQNWIPFSLDTSGWNGYIQILISEINIDSYLFFFIIGILLYVNYSYIKRLVEGNFIYFFGVYILYCSILHQTTDVSGLRYTPDLWCLIGYFIMALTIISATYTKPLFAEKYLKGQDISYGIYIYHMLFLNVFLKLNLFEGTYNFILLSISTILMALLSWFLIEKNGLKLKSNSLRQLVN